MYADDADYQVVVRVADDDMAANFAGVAGTGNYVDTMTLVQVANVPPIPAGPPLIVNEGTAITLAALGVHLEDIGFDNPANQTTPTVGTRSVSRNFTACYDRLGRRPRADTRDDRQRGGRVSGSAGVKTTAQFIHSDYMYADDGVYTVRVRVADDNMGAFETPHFSRLASERGVDYIDLEFTIQVNNVVPVLAPPVPRRRRSPKPNRSTSRFRSPTSASTTN